MSPGPRSTSLADSTLVHPAVWPQYMAEKWGGASVPFFFFGGGELGPHLAQFNCRLGRGPPPYQVASLSIQPFAV